MNKYKRGGMRGNPSDPHWLMEAPPQGNEADCNSFVPPFSSSIPF